DKVDEIYPAVEQALEMARMRGDLVEMGFSAFSLGGLCGAKFDPVQAVSWFEESLACYKQIDDPIHRAYYQAEAMAWMGWSYLQMGRLDEAEMNFRQGRELCREIGDTLHEAVHMHSLAAVAFAAGRTDEGRQHIRKAKDLGAPASFEVWSALLALMSGD